jgi:hypothetical protein
MCCRIDSENRVASEQVVQLVAMQAVEKRSERAEFVAEERMRTNGTQEWYAEHRRPQNRFAQ